MTELSIDCARAEDWLPTLETGSVQLVVADPPYFRVLEEGWDRQWKNDTAFIDWLASISDELLRILAPNGSLYLFCSSRMAARIEVMLAERFEILNSITWAKPEERGGKFGRAKKEDLRTYFPTAERVIFAEQLGADSMAMGVSRYATECERLRGIVFEPLRSYLEDARLAAGVSRKEVDVACGVASVASKHYFSRSQWLLPIAAHYAKMQALFNGHLRREYEDLRREYERFRLEYEDLRRPFNLSASVPNTDIWTYETPGGMKGRHPAQKPQLMMADIIRASSRPGDLVVDCFSGSGTTAAACVETGRKFRGCEVDPGIHAESLARLEQSIAVQDGRVVNGKATAASFSGPLFDLID